MALFAPSVQSVKNRNPGAVLLSLAIIVAMLYFGRAFFITMVSAIVLSFILEPFVVFLMRARLPRSLASFVVCAAAVSLLYLLGLGVYTQVTLILEDLPMYSQRIGELRDGLTARVGNMEEKIAQILASRKVSTAPPPVQPDAGRRRRAKPPDPAVPPPVQEVRIQQEQISLINYAYGYIADYSHALLMASFVPFLVYFLLSWRDHMRRTFLQLFEGADRHVAGKSWEGIANLARAYVLGNFLLGLFLAIASAMAFYYFRLPYWLLVGPLSGFLSLVPYIGLPLAIVPPVLAALPVYDQLAPYLALSLTVGLFHLIALNLLYPKLVGSRVHLNPLAVTVALMFWGSLWGGIGLLLGIPITAGVKAVCDNVSSLQKYGRLLGD